MRDNYSKQNLIVVTIVAGALALVIGFAAGALLTMPDRQKTQTAVNDARTELKAKTTAIAQLRATITELNRLRAANDKTITRLQAKIAGLNEPKVVSTTKSINPGKTKVNPKSSSDSPDVGEQGYLQGEHLFGPQNPKCVPMAMTREILDSYVDALISNDAAGAANLFSAGGMFPVADGTRILRLYPGGSTWSNLYKRKVRILNGEHAGKIAWVGSDWVKK